MSNLYALVNIKIAGEKFYARPTEFEFDKDRQPIAIKKIVTTCPKCSAYNEYIVNIINNVEEIILKCKNCEPDIISPVDKVEEKTKKSKPKKTKLVKKDTDQNIDNQLIVVNPSDELMNDIEKKIDSEPEPNEKEDKPSIEIINTNINSDFVDPIKLGLFNVEQV